MPRLIDANALELELRAQIKKITPIENNRDMFFHDSGINGAITGAILATRNAPTIDAMHGRWEINPDGYYPYCSNCKTEPESGKMTNYCPNCGARMDLEVDK